MGRYFAIGASLGSISGLLALVLIWSWMTIHLGLIGFLIGWIPAGLAAAAVWLIMVLLWGPILALCVLIGVGLLILAAASARHRVQETPPAAAASDAAPAPPDTPPNVPDETPAPESATPAEPLQASPAPAPPPAPLPTESSAVARPRSSLDSSPPRAPNSSAKIRSPAEDLGGDAAAAGDTSRKPQP